MELAQENPHGFHTFYHSTGHPLASIPKLQRVVYQKHAYSV